MWLAGPSTDDSDEWAAELEMGAGGWHRDVAVADGPIGDQITPGATGQADDVEQRLGEIAAEEGWDEDEVQAIRAYLSEVTPQAPATSRVEVLPPLPTATAPDFELPGADELDEAMAALSQPAAHAETVSPEPPMEPSPAARFAAPTRDPEERSWSRPDDREPVDAATAANTTEWPGLDREYRSTAAQDIEAAEGLAQDAPEAVDPHSLQEPEPEWLRGRQDAAARAYRRLRRIFPNPDR